MVARNDVAREKIGRGVGWGSMSFGNASGGLTDELLHSPLHDRSPKTGTNVLTVLNVLVKKAVAWDVRTEAHPRIRRSVLRNGPLHREKSRAKIQNLREDNGAGSPGTRSKR
jgi:hypothetical protein